MTDRIKVSESELQNLITQLKRAANDTSDISVELKRMKLPYCLDYHVIGAKIELMRYGMEMAKITDRMNSLARVLNIVITRFDACEKILGGVFGEVNLEELLIHSVNVSTTMKDIAIRAYEKDHEEQARRLNDFLSAQGTEALTEEDRRNIKYLIYSASEPYRSIFLNSLDKYTIGTVDGTGGVFKPSDNTVNYNYPNSFADDPRTAYNVFFHECGHAIDYNSNYSNTNDYDTVSYTTYSDAMGRDVTVLDAIMYDVYENRENPYSVTSIAERLQSERSSLRKQL